MREIKANIFDMVVETIVITTNGIVKRNGEAVMGAGIALEMAKKYPLFPKVFGDKLKKDGNHVFMFFVPQVKGRKVITFPVKNHFKEKASLELIEQSCKEIVILADKFELTQIALPRPGCGVGGLKWKDVEPILEKHFDQRFFIVDKKDK